jgi:head-tail adaptor
MSIDKYFREIKILQQVGTTNQIGGRDKQWNVIATLNGVINCNSKYQTNSAGREGEQSEYKGYFEYSDKSTEYLQPEYRLKDTDGKIYTINGIPKNTMNRNHHYKVELTYIDYIN